MAFQIYKEGESKTMTSNRLVLLTIALLLPFSSAGCKYFGKTTDAQPKSMEQIQQETGVPVKVEKVAKSPFTTELKYSADLQARSEAVRYSRVSDVVRQVLFNVGDYVREGQTVVTFPHNNQTTQYYQLKAGFDLAEQTYRRMRNMYNEGVISKHELDIAKADYEVARANLNTTDDSLRAKAPLSGYITQMNVRPTDNVSSGDPLFTVSNLDWIEARIWVSSQEIKQIKPGQKIRLDWDGVRCEGRVSQVSRIMDNEKKAFAVKALFQNKEKILTSGVTAEVAIETYYNAQAVTVQRKNLVAEEGKQFVYVVDNGMAAKRAVGIGAEQGPVVEIISGLNPGEALIVEGNQMVADQTKVKIVK
jgi:membrane fusion protein (multidrug efflux system)